MMMTSMASKKKHGPGAEETHSEGLPRRGPNRLEAQITDDELVLLNRL